MKLRWAWTSWLPELCSIPFRLSATKENASSFRRTLCVMSSDYVIGWRSCTMDAFSTWGRSMNCPRGIIKAISKNSFSNFFRDSIDLWSRCMNWSRVRLIFTREMRDQVRDRRTMFTIFVLPLLLYPFMGMLMLQVAQFHSEHAVHITIVGPENGPTELPLLENDPPPSNGTSTFQKIAIFAGPRPLIIPIQPKRVIGRRSRFNRSNRERRISYSSSALALPKHGGSRVTRPC